ncbi:MAG: sensor histidine kinase KdpD, partial [Holdemanella biformis]|nr:sensor histidine kinase KdpD [Holdemanella biformis]
MEEARNGKLTIFFGYCAGVGKTFSMLNTAQQKSVEGVDVVIGYIESHDRPDTQNLTYGLEKIPTKEVLYKGHHFSEFDLDKALDRHPQLILVDELAHTNAPTSRHKKRYSDIEELLRAGIDVYTTVNVQHIESLHDVVESITKVKVNERIPDYIFNDADDVKLIDVDINDLIERLKQGKIYSKTQAKRALENFFIKDNLIALREISLRKCADRINLYAKDENKQFLKEKILVCLGTSPTNQKVIRTASKMAQAFHGEFTALYVENSDSQELDLKAFQQLKKNISLAKELQANIVSTSGDDIAYQISQYAKTAGVSKLVLGRSYQKKSIFNKPTIVDKLTKLSPNLDIYIIPDNNSSNQNLNSVKYQYQNFFRFSTRDSSISISTLLIITILAYFAQIAGFDITTIILLYVLSSCIIGSLTLLPIYSFIIPFINVCLINYLFINPKYSLEIISSEYVMVLIVMIVVSFIINVLNFELKKGKNSASLRAYSMEVLLETSQKLQQAKTYNDVMKETCVQLNKWLKRIIIFYPVNRKMLDKPYIYNPNNLLDDSNIFLTEKERTVAKWVYINNKNAGPTTSTLQEAKALYLSIRRNDKIYGVIGIDMISNK